MSSEKSSIGMQCNRCSLELKIEVSPEWLEGGGPSGLTQRLQTALINFAQSLEECPCCGDKSIWNSTLRISDDV